MSVEQPFHKSRLRGSYHSKLTSWNIYFPRCFVAYPLHRYNALVPSLLPDWQGTGSMSALGVTKKAKLSERGEEQPGRWCASFISSHVNGFSLCKALEESRGAFGARAWSFGSERNCSRLLKTAALILVLHSSNAAMKLHTNNSLT